MNQTQHITTTNVHLKTWVSREFEEHFARVAKAQGLSESALLRRLLENMVVRAREPDDMVITPVEELPSTRRVSIRLRADDLLLLQERAKARDLPTSTYISYLVRSHNLARDFREFLDAVRVENADIVGHSMAGLELTHLAVAAPGKVRRLVYLDAATDKSPLQGLWQKNPAGTGNPPPEALSSWTTLIGWTQQLLKSHSPAIAANPASVFCCRSRGFAVSPATRSRRGRDECLGIGSSRLRADTASRIGDLFRL